jgi:drug/metabolite transporter (DMT)-like permease
LLAASVALAGVCVMVGGGGARGAGFGLVLSLAMTVGMGLLTVIGRWSRGVSMIPATCVSAVQLAVIGVVATPLLAVSARDIAVLAVFAMTQSAALACYMEGARRLSASRSALLSALDVPLGPLWVLLLVGEVPPLATVAGGVIVLAAVMWDIVRAGQPASVSA